MLWLSSQASSLHQLPQSRSAPRVTAVNPAHFGLAGCLPVYLLDSGFSFLLCMRSILFHWKLFFRGSLRQQAVPPGIGKAKFLLVAVLLWVLFSFHCHLARSDCRDFVLFPRQANISLRSCSLPHLSCFACAGAWHSARFYCPFPSRSKVTNAMEECGPLLSMQFKWALFV